MSSHKKKILIFSLAYYPKHIGGAEVAVKEITDRISPSECEFHMITNRYDSTLPEVEQVGNVLVHRIGITTKNPEMEDLKRWPLHINKGLFQFLAYFKAKKLHNEYSYDGIWGIMAHASGIPAGLFKNTYPEVTYILTLQEGDPLQEIEKTMRIFGPLFKRGFTKADILQSISNFLEKWGQNMGFKGESFVIPNAVNVAHFNADISEDEINRVCDELGKKEGDVFLITTSRLVKKNAIDDVVRALALLPENIHFVVYGTGPDEKMLKELVTSEEVEDRVHFGGHISHSEMPIHLKACNIFIRPSRSEGMGNSFIEAMAAGLPVIATQEGGIADFLYDAKRNPEKPATGWAVDKDSPEQIAKTVEDILANPDEVARVTENARALVIEKYDWNIIAKDMREKVFSQVIKH